jgi:hypothetical protein
MSTINRHTMLIYSLATPHVHLTLGITPLQGAVSNFIFRCYPYIYSGSLIKR